MSAGQRAFGLSRSEDADSRLRLKRLEVLRCIDTRGAVSRSYLAHRLDLSKARVSSYVNELLAEGICREIGEADSRHAGRKRIMLELNPDYRYVLGLDLGSSEPRIFIADMGASIRATEAVDLLSARSYTERLQSILSAANDLLDRAEAFRERCVLLAVNAPGVVNDREGSFYADGIFQDWEIARLAHEAAGELGLDDYLVNDVNAATWGEFISRRKEPDNMIYLAGGIGLGAGLIIDKQLYTGRNGRAGEVSDLLLRKRRPDEPSDTNDRDYLRMGERASIHSLLNDLARYAPAGSLQRIGRRSDERQELSKADLEALIRTGDPYTLERLRDMALAMGEMLSNIAILLDPDCVVLGGDFSPMSAVLLPQVNEFMANYLSRPLKLESSALGADAGIYGLVRLAVDQLLYGLSSADQGTAAKM